MAAGKHHFARIFLKSDWKSLEIIGKRPDAVAVCNDFARCDPASGGRIGFSSGAGGRPAPAGRTREMGGRDAGWRSSPRFRCRPPVMSLDILPVYIPLAALQVFLQKSRRCVWASCGRVAPRSSLFSELLAPGTARRRASAFPGLGASVFFGNRRAHPDTAPGAPGTDPASS